MTFPTTSSNEPKEGTATTPAQEQTPAANQPGTITVKELNELEARLSQKIDQVYRGTQSRQDQFTAKVQKKLDAFESAAKATGIQLTDAQRKAAQDNAVFQALSEETPTAQSGGNALGQAQSQGNAEDELAASVNNAAIAMQKAWGVDLAENDPEYIELVKPQESGDAKDYLDATYKAIQAKLARTGTSPTAQPPAASGIPKSPGVVKGTPIPNLIQDVNDSDELWKLTKFNKS